MLSNRPSSFVAAVPATSSADDIADAVARWQARYQPAGLATPAAPVAAAPAAPVVEAPVLKEAGANWFAEARRQDQADQDEIKDRIARVMGRRILG
jgi:hypothetical protein